jgi:Tfp pilus assembly protein PilP
VARPAPRPSAPPLPFQFVARIVDGGSTAVYVMLGEDHYSVKAGQVIDRNYRVEKVTETAVTFTYLPLRTRQVLALN